ncbi:DUF4221 family protein [Marivirga sp.]|uniref:DUF4221 family protein n=1 Tax=Marivirga sp. TaxID=2018662 RepID=UPI003DA6FF86
MFLARSILGYFILLLVFAMACNEKNIQELDYSITPYPIKTGYDGTNFYFNYTLQNTDSGEYIYYYDHLMKRISIVDFDNKEIIDHIPLNNDKYEIKGVGEIILSDTSLILRNMNWFYWVSNDGLVQNYADPETFKGMRFKDEFDYTFGYKTSYQNHINKSEDIIQFSKFPSNYDKNHFSKSRLVKVFLNKDSIINSNEPLDFSNYKNENETFGFRSNPFIISMNNEVYVTYPFTPDIHIYNRDDLSLEMTVELSNYDELPNNKPITIAKFKEITEENFQNETPLDDQTYYHNLYYDPYRELFYRPVKREILEHEEVMDYKMWLLIFNQDMELLGKLDLEDKFSPFLYISKKGLFIRKKKQQENRIDLHRIDFELP